MQHNFGSSLLLIVTAVFLLMGAFAAVIAVIRKPSWMRLLVLLVCGLAVFSTLLLGGYFWVHEMQVAEEARRAEMGARLAAVGDSLRNDFPAVALLEPGPAETFDAFPNENVDGPRVHGGIPTWAGLALVGLLSVCVATGAIVAYRHRAWFVRHAPVLMSVLALAGILFVGIVLARTTDITGSTRTAALQAQRAEAQLPAASGDEHAGADPAPAAELPDWVRSANTDSEHLDGSPIVLVSDQWASVAECEVQLDTLAKQVVARQLQQLEPRTRGWTPPARLLDGAITRRFVERTLLQIGQYETPMYRTYWELKVSPTVREQALAEWQKQTVSERLGWLGGALAAVMAVLVAAAVYFRMGRNRGDGSGEGLKLDLDLRVG